MGDQQQCYEQQCYEQQCYEQQCYEQQCYEQQCYEQLSGIPFHHTTHVLKEVFIPKREPDTVVIPKVYDDIINVGHGDPNVFRSWWTHHNILPSIPTQTIPLYEYQEEDFSELERATHYFHQLFGTDADASLVYGNGSTQVINAILYAVSKLLRRRIIVGYAPPVYMLMHEFLINCQLVEVTFDLDRRDIDVEIVIDPNNPSGEHRTSKSTATYIIFDRAYNWPIYQDHIVPTSLDKNHITVYTISKALGMGGLRLGWAFINNNVLTKEVQRALFVIGICPNSFGMAAATRIFNDFILDPNLLLSYHTELKDTIESRRKLVANCPQFITTNRSGPYAWISSYDGSDIAATLLNNYQIKVYSGTQFASTCNYARFSLINDSNDFNTAINRLMDS
jgi:aspartate/methionine/tyrosine aminotransferase